VAVLDDVLVSSQRSQMSRFAEIEAKVRDIDIKLSNGISTHEKEILERMRRVFMSKLENVREVEATYKPLIPLSKPVVVESYPKLWGIPYEYMGTPQVTRMRPWLKVSIPYSEVKSKFWGDKHRSKKAIRWRVSEHYLPVIDTIYSRIEESR
jgi:hypothetical protein